MTHDEKKIATLERRLSNYAAELEEKDRQLKEANRLKTEFLARMSHDLRTPMNAIVGYARILLRKLHNHIEPRQYQNLENIQTSAHHLLDLINDILDLSKVEAGRVEVHPETVALPRLVSECMAAVAPLVKNDVTITADVASVAELYTDPDRLKRALTNLLSNAVQYTDQGHISVEARRIDGHVEIAVTDTGVGICAAELPHIFDVFRQVARKGQSALEGTGLGLAIVKRSVELLGGKVNAQSTEGKGTTFTLVLPDITQGAST